MPRYAAMHSDTALHSDAAMHSDTALLEVSGLTVRYGAITALRDASLTVGSGEVVGLIGPNGAGKTTLLGSIAGLLAPAAGSVTFDGADVTGAPPERLLRSGLALVPEHRRIFADMTVEENLRIGAVTQRASERAESLQEATELFPVLADKWHTRGGYLSGGEAQQLAIARALMSRPRLLMMDEPSLGLAPLLTDLVFGLISSLRETGRTLLVVEQNAQRMLEVADRAYVLRSGEVVAAGTGAELRRRGDLFDTFVGGPAGSTAGDTAGSTPATQDPSPSATPRPGPADNTANRTQAPPGAPGTGGTSEGETTAGPADNTVAEDASAASSRAVGSTVGTADNAETEETATRAQTTPPTTHQAATETTGDIGGEAAGDTAGESRGTQ